MTSTKNKYRVPYVHTRSQGLEFFEPSLTEPQFAEETDINGIVYRMQRGEFTSNADYKEPIYGTTFSPNQVQDAVETLRQAQNEFNALPSNVRAFFKNNPNELISFVQDENNLGKAIELGIVDINKLSDEKYDFYQAYKKDNSLTLSTHIANLEKIKNNTGVISPEINGGDIAI